MQFSVPFKEINVDVLEDLHKRVAQTRDGTKSVACQISLGLLKSLCLRFESDKIQHGLSMVASEVTKKFLSDSAAGAGKITACLVRIFAESFS